MNPFDPETIIRTLAQHDVQYVLVGATAARLQGFPRLTAAADITPAADAENLRHLAAALRALNAKVFTESVPEGLAFDIDQSALLRAEARVILGRLCHLSWRGLRLVIGLLGRNAPA